MQSSFDMYKLTESKTGMSVLMYSEHNLDLHIPHRRKD